MKKILVAITVVAVSIWLMLDAYATSDVRVIQQQQVIIERQKLELPVYTFRFDDSQPRGGDRETKVSLIRDEDAPAAPDEGGNIDDNRVKLILQNHCASCHTGSGSKKGVKIFLERGTLNPDIDPWKLLTFVQKGSMPPSGPLDKSDRFVLEEWARHAKKVPVK